MIASILILVVVLGLVGLLVFVLVNDQRRENEKRRAARKLLRDE